MRKSHIIYIFEKRDIPKVFSSTGSKHEYTVYSNILNRDVNTKELGAKWVSDIRYIRGNNKWVYRDYDDRFC